MPHFATERSVVRHRRRRLLHAQPSSDQRNRLYRGVMTTESKFSGLVDGLHGQARQERRELIQWLLDSGFDADQIRNAESPILLPANRIFGDDGTLVSARDIANVTGAPLELVTQTRNPSCRPRRWSSAASTRTRLSWWCGC
jgi:Adenylate cyclase regulatory domain